MKRRGFFSAIRIGIFLVFYINLAGPGAPWQKSDHKAGLPLPDPWDPRVFQ